VSLKPEQLAQNHCHIVLQGIRRAVGDVRDVGAEVDGVTIRPCTGDAAGADSAAGTGHIFNDDWLTEGDLHPLGEVARNHIRCSAGHHRHYDSDRPRRIGLCPYDARGGRQRDSARCQMQEFATRVSI
jgi:hypothetical protein